MKTALLLTASALLVFALPFAAQAQFSYKTNDGTIAITGYTGPGGEVTIPIEIDGLPVTCVADWAFYWLSSLAKVTIPTSVISIGDNAFDHCSLIDIVIPTSVSTIGNWAFSSCYGLTNVTIPSGVTSIGNWTFAACTNLVHITIPKNITSIGLEVFSGCRSLKDIVIPNNVISIGPGAFSSCSSLIDITIPESVTKIERAAFGNCTGLTNVTIGRSLGVVRDLTFADCPSLVGVHFEGDCPGLAWENLIEDFYDWARPFARSTNVTVFYLPGTLGWGTTYAGRPTEPWVLPYPLILSTTPNFGTQANGFGFIISWATNVPVVVEASASLVNPAWTPLCTNTLLNGVSHFSDKEWQNHSARFYRVRAQ